MPSETPKLNATQNLAVSHDEWEKTPASVQALVLQLLKRIEELEAKLAEFAEFEPAALFGQSIQKTLFRQRGEEEQSKVTKRTQGISAANARPNRDPGYLPQALLLRV